MEDGELSEVLAIALGIKLEFPVVKHVGVITWRGGQGSYHGENVQRPDDETYQYRQRR